MEALMKILKDLHPDADYENNDRLVDGKVLDSFDIVTIIAEVDNEYGVAIPAEEIVPENFNSAKSLYALIKRLMQED
jgi:D-alanine--poly(phosphoribitol) ligase subunit 2